MEMIITLNGLGGSLTLLLVLSCMLLALFKWYFIIHHASATHGTYIQHCVRNIDQFLLVLGLEDFPNGPTGVLY